MEEVKNLSGISLLVPSVQELVKENGSNVPPRYIRPQLEDLVISETNRTLEIPVIDMQRLISLQSGNEELTKLHLACKEWGFFQGVTEETEMRELFEDGIQMMRMNYYPPCPQPEKVIGLINHSDRVGLTILLQVNEVEGLQIRKDGMWVSVKPLPNAFIVNVADMLEIITNGIYKSIEHRAIVNSEKERLSIATFYSPRQDGVIGPSASLITEQTPARFKRIGVNEFFKGIYARKFDGKSYLDIMRIEHDG